MLANVFDITSCFRLSLPCGGRLISVIHIRSMEKISTHALRGEGDLCVIARDKFKLAFQSTPSVGRATRCRCGYTKSSEHFNPRPPWGGRPLLMRCFRYGKIISNHAIRGEGDESMSSRK